MAVFNLMKLEKIYDNNNNNNNNNNTVIKTVEKKFFKTLKFLAMLSIMCQFPIQTYN